MKGFYPPIQNGLIPIKVAVTLLVMGSLNPAIIPLPVHPLSQPPVSMKTHGATQIVQ